MTIKIVDSMLMSNYDIEDEVIFIIVKKSSLSMWLARLACHVGSYADSTTAWTCHNPGYPIGTK